MKFVILDLDGTLAIYSDRQERFGALCQGILAAHVYLEETGVAVRKDETLWARVIAESQEAEDHRVRPLEGRLLSIFHLREDQLSPGDMLEICRRCMSPLMEHGVLFGDALETLARLRELGAHCVLASNTPWGSPSYLWREELVRLGIDEALDDAVFCRDAGWRKPSPRFYSYLLARIGAQPDECLFVGDDMKEDLLGPRAAGMSALLVDRTKAPRPDARDRIGDLDQLFDSPLFR